MYLFGDLQNVYNFQKLLKSKKLNEIIKEKKFDSVKKKNNPKYALNYKITVFTITVFSFCLTMKCNYIYFLLYYFSDLFFN